MKRKSGRTAVKENRRAVKENRRTDVKGAIRRLGFRSFTKYVLSRSDKTLVQMADELGLNHAYFLNYHKKWAVDTLAEPLL